MKTMHYRIRVVALALVVSLFAVILWIVKTVWVSSGDGSGISPDHEALVAVPSSEPDPWLSPVINPEETVSTFQAETAAPSAEMPSPEPLFDTTGL